MTAASLLIPDDVRAAAQDAFRAVFGLDATAGPVQIKIIARAILAERERNAGIAEARARWMEAHDAQRGGRVFASNALALRRIADAIRSQSQPPAGE